MGFRRFTQYFFLFIIAFVGINALLWYGWTREIMDPYRNGDLLRIGYILGYDSPRKNTDDLPKRHIRMSEYNGQPVDVVTIGDSFSAGGGGGRNSYYQDHIASLQGLTVLNVPFDIIGGSDVESAPITTLSKMVNSGYLDIIKPKYLLLESVERFAIQRYAKQVTFNKTATVEEIDSTFKKQKSDKKQKKIDATGICFINNGNWKLVGNNIQYLFRDNAWGSMVHISRLNRRLFSSNKGDQLIFYSDDIKNRSRSTSASVAAMNKNLNNLAALLKTKGITLIFMPVVDKLNLYEPYLQKQRYPRSVFFEELRKLPKDYLVLDTKEVLTRSLEKGELDLYHQDDSHWSWKACEAIFSTVRISELSNAEK